VRGVNEKLAPALKGYGYRGFISTEVRCTEDGKAYLIDPCCRAGSPPNEVYQLIMANLAEVVWYGAEGIVIEPEYNAKWGAEVLLISEWADQNWMQISFPEKIRDNVKLRNLCRIEDEYYVIPQWTGCAEIGAIVALGDTPQQAIDEVKRIAELVHGHLLDKPIDALDKAGEQMEELLGPDKPLTKDQRKAEELFKAGKISDRQLDKVMAKG
jgi:predicted RNase H-like HicB family nuclease